MRPLTRVFYTNNVDADRRIIKFIKMTDRGFLPLYKLYGTWFQKLVF